MPINDMSGFDDHGIAHISPNRIEVRDQVMLDTGPTFGETWVPVRDVDREDGSTTLSLDFPERIERRTYSDHERLQVRRAVLYDLNETIQIDDVDAGTTVTTTLANLLKGI